MKKNKFTSAATQTFFLLLFLLIHHDAINAMNPYEIINDETAKHLCDQCDKKCIGASLLKTYIRVNTGERPFACTLCKQSFTHTGNLARHIQQRKYTDYCSQDNSLDSPVPPTINDYPLEPLFDFDNYHTNNRIYFLKSIK
jgi:hypothetical protein